jgi:hypothetical protein
MEFAFALILGACIGLIIGILIGLELAPRPDATKEVGNLFAEAEKKLDELQKTQNKIDTVKLKAGACHWVIKSRLSELSNQE